MDKRTKKLFKLVTPYLLKANPDRLNHTLRVFKTATFLAEKEKADLNIVKFAALLHDVGKYKDFEGNHHAIIGGEISEKILKNFKLSPEKKEKIIYCVKQHCYDESINPELIEAKIIRDADTLDRLSPVRIASYFYYGGLKKRDYSEIVKRIETSLEYAKKFHTKTGKRLAERRRKLLDSFITSFKDDLIIIKSAGTKRKK